MHPSVAEFWIRIEKILRENASRKQESALAVQGKIAQSLQDLLREPNSMAALAELGILGAAFLFDEGPGSSWALFEQHPDTLAGEQGRAARVRERVTSVRTPFIIRNSTDYPTATVTDLVEQIFFDVRRKQEELVNSSEEVQPEFFRWLPRLYNEPALSEERDPSPFAFERRQRSALGVHYVSSGEILLGILTWRALHYSLALGRGPEDVSAILDLSPDAMTPAPPLDWLGTPLDIISDGTADLVGTLRDKACHLRTWSGEVAYWLSQHRAAALSRFTHAAILSTDTLSEQKNSDSGKINEMIAAYIRAIVGKNDMTVLEALSEFERNARFPVPAYFYWHLVEPALRAHLVAPIWTSALNPKSLGALTDSAYLLQTSVGLALSAMHPIDELEPPKSDAKGSPSLTGAIEIISVLRQIGRPLVEFVFYEPRKRRENAARANQLVASIMARNLSHNIGSHVLYHLREELLDGGPSDVADLIRYLQARMDFIALASSGGATWPGSVTYNRLREPFQHEEDKKGRSLPRRSLLLSNIVRSQRAKPPLVQFQIVSPDSDESAPNSTEKAERNPVFAIPCGAVGVQAVYSIVENYLRNSAKYGLGSFDDQLEIKITIDRDPDWPDYYRCTVSDNNASDTESAQQVRDSFAEPIFDHNNPDASFKNWGLKEIKIAALFLAGGASAIKEEYQGIAADETTPQPFWTISNAIENRSALGFTFHLRRPMGICLIANLGADDTLRMLELRLFQLHGSGNDLLTSRGEAKQKFELIVIEERALADMLQHDARELVTEKKILPRVAQLAMRLGYVGSETELPATFADLGAIQMASSLDALALSLSNCDPSQLGPIVGAMWVEKQWPNKRTVLAIANPSRAEEILPLFDETRQEFAAFEVVENAHNLLVWDHSRYYVKPQKNSTDTSRVPTAYKQFGFHCPIALPFYPGISSRDGAWRLKEAACMQIGIIDERLWASQESPPRAPGYGKLHFEENVSSAWQRAGVFLIPPSALSAFDRDANALPALLPAQSTSGKRLDVLVVHRSLIDQEAKRRCEHVRRTLERRIRREDLNESIIKERIIAWLKTATVRLIITSGRGLEPTYRQAVTSTNSSFLEFSVLAEAILDNTGDKVSLVRLLRGV